LPGGSDNIKSIYIKSTDSPAVPIYVDTQTNANELKLTNNMTPRLVKKSKKLSVKRLAAKKQAKSKRLAKKPKSAGKKIMKKNLIK
jgi:hypothetical protein